jgi:hypothetical protein
MKGGEMKPDIKEAFAVWEDSKPYQQYDNKVDALVGFEAGYLAAQQKALLDTKRLDYIEAHPEKNLQKHKKHWSFMGFTNYEYEAFPTLREAIDAARKTV